MKRKVTNVLRRGSNNGAQLLVAAAVVGLCEGGLCLRGHRLKHVKHLLGLSRQRCAGGKGGAGAPICPELLVPLALDVAQALPKVEANEQVEEHHNGAEHRALDGEVLGEREVDHRSEEDAADDRHEGAGDCREEELVEHFAPAHRKIKVL
eukprot:2243815-Prymnesium_polylepis.1